MLAASQLLIMPRQILTSNFSDIFWQRGKTELAKNVRIYVRPSEDMVPLAEVSEYEPDKSKHYYTGTDPTTLSRFASEKTLICFKLVRITLVENCR